MAIRLAGQRWEYTLQEDRESDAPTVFVIRELTAGERGEISGLYPPPPTQGEEEADDAYGQRLDEWRRQTRESHQRLCRLGITEVRGILNPDGTQADLGVDDVVAGLADPAHVHELALAVLERNRLGNEEKKA